MSEWTKRPSNNRLGVVALFGSLLSTLSLGCANTLALQIDFPNEGAKLISNSVDITLVPVTSDSLDECATLLNTPTLSTGIQTNDIPICELLGYALPDPGGPAAVLVRVRDDTRTVILEGCTVADIYPNAAPVPLALFPTAAYSVRYDREPPAAGATLATRCGGR